MKSQKDMCRNIVLGRFAQARTPRGLIRLVLSILFTAVALTMSEASAQTLTTLHPFGSRRTDGQDPAAGLIAGAAGNFYGTTSYGGKNGYGTVFKLTPSGSESVVYSFGSSSADGQYPYAGLLADAYGNLYGTTYQGGAYGYGTVFKVTPSKSVPWTETVLYSFGSSSTDGQGPLAGLIIDASGNLYGTTNNGGTSNLGTVFKLTPSGSETILHSFSGFPSDGAYPQAGLIADASGNFYSTTNQGGASNGGTVFEVTPSGTETVLYSFANSPDGLDPYAGLIADASGNFYSTTAAGGENGTGTVFELMNQGGTWTETVLYSFGTGSSGDGLNPYAGLIADASGNLYGTTSYGGDSTNCRGGGCGTVFKVTPSGIETVLYSFTDGSDGEDPNGLIAGGSGNLYGTTSAGGADASGTVFELTGAGYVGVPFATLTPTSLTFPPQPIGTTSAPLQATLTNTGGAALEITGIGRSGDFYEGYNCPRTMQPGASCIITVTITPSRAGTRTGTVQITDNAPGSPQKLLLIGSGSGTGSIILSLSPPSLDFGSDPVGSTSSPQTVTVTNVGTATASFVTPFGFTIKGTDPNDFGEQSSCGTSLAPNQSCTVAVTFTPTASGARTGVFAVIQGSASVQIPVSGTGN